jgi:uncharacterized protein YjaZ
MVFFVETQDSWYNKLLSRQEFAKFVATSLSGKFKQDQKAWVGKVAPAAADRIKSICGETVGRIMVSSSAIVHAYSKPSHNLLPTDLLHIVEIINSENTVIEISNEHRISEPTAKMIKFKVNIQGSFTLVEEVRVSKKYKGWLDLVTCYRKKKVKDA